MGVGGGSPAGRRREEREGAGNGESLRNVSSREGRTSGARRNAQTRILAGGAGDGAKQVEAEESLKRKKKKKQDTNP